MERFSSDTILHEFFLQAVKRNTTVKSSTSQKNIKATQNKPRITASKDRETATEHVEDLHGEVELGGRLVERDAGVGGAEGRPVVGEREPRGEDGDVRQRLLAQARAVHLLLRPAPRDDNEQISVRLLCVFIITITTAGQDLIVLAEGVEEHAKVLVGRPAGGGDEDGDLALSKGCLGLCLSSTGAGDGAVGVGGEIGRARRQLLAEEACEEGAALRGRERAEGGRGLVVEDADGDGPGDARPGPAEVRGERARDGEVRVGAGAKGALEAGVRAHEGVRGAEREREERVAEVVPVDDERGAREARGGPRERERRHRGRVLHEDVRRGPAAHRERPEQLRALRHDLRGRVEHVQRAAQGALDTRGERGDGREEHEAHAVRAQGCEGSRGGGAARRDHVHVRHARGLVRKARGVVAHPRAVAHVAQHHHRHGGQSAPPLRRRRAPPTQNVPHSHSEEKTHKSQENASNGCHHLRRGDLEE